MSKILLFSDLHLHCHKNSLQRLQDCLDVLRWVFQTARSRGIRDVVFLGDLFHDRQKIQVIVYHNAFDLFYEFQDLNIYLLLGNHDLWFYDKWDISSVTPLMGLSNVQIIDKPCKKTIAGTSIDFLPFTHNPVKNITEDFVKKSAVLCAHLAIDDAILNKIHNTRSEVSIENEKDVQKVSAELFNEWQRVFLGHYHCGQKVDNRVEYVGSPLELSFNEAAQQKHIVILDLQTLECEYVVNNFSPKHLIINESEIDQINLQNNFVQIQVENIESLEIVDIRKQILERNNVQSLEFKEIKKRDLERREEIQEKFDIANGDVLERYIKAVGTDLDYRKLLEIGKDICLEN